MTPRSRERPNRYFAFLRGLRAGGRSNMFGAIPYLCEAFGCSREDAFTIVCQWIDSQASEASVNADVLPSTTSGSRESSSRTAAVTRRRSA